jgi:predicted ATP-dependent endonuclease of OLD family
MNIKKIEIENFKKFKQLSVEQMSVFIKELVKFSGISPIEK